MDNKRSQQTPKKIVRTYFKNPYSNKLEYLKEINEFLDTFDSPRLN